MKLRRVLVVLGSVIALLLIALVVLAVWAHRQEEIEKNRKQTAPARAAKLSKDNTPAETVAGESKEEPATKQAEQLPDVPLAVSV